MPGGTWGVSASYGQQGGFTGSGSVAPVNPYSPSGQYSLGGGQPDYYGRGDTAVEKRQFADVGKMNINLLDPLAQSRAESNYMPIDQPEGPFGGLQRYYSAQTPGGLFSGLLGAGLQTVGGIFGEEAAKTGAQIGQTVGKTLEAPLAVVGGLGVDNIPFIAPILDAANSEVEKHTPYILRDTLKIPTNVGGAFQSMLNVFGLAGRAVERTYAGLEQSRGALPEDIERLIGTTDPKTGKVLTRDDALDELVMSGRGFTDDPWANMVFSIFTDPANWASLGVGAVAGAVRGTGAVARTFGAAVRAAEVGTPLARLATEAGPLREAALAAQRGEAVTPLVQGRQMVSQMRAALADNGHPANLKLVERLGMSALGPVSEETGNTVARVGHYILKATDPVNFFSGSRAGQRGMDALVTSGSTGVVAALKPKVVNRLVNLAGDLTTDGEDRMLSALGTWGANAIQEVGADDLANDALKVDALQKVGSLNPTETTRAMVRGGAWDTNMGKFVEIHVERTKSHVLGTLPEKELYDQTVAKLASILGVSPSQVVAKLGDKVSLDEAHAVHGMYYYAKGEALHGPVMDAMRDARLKGTLPKELGDPENLTMIAPRTLTKQKGTALAALVKAKDKTAVRAAIEEYDDFNWANTSTVPDDDLLEIIGNYLDANADGLPEEFQMLDANGNPIPGLPTALEDWLRDSGVQGYGLGSRVPADAPLEAQWRITRNAKGEMVNVRPWLDMWTGTGARAKKLSRWDTMHMQMFRSVRQERISWQQRRRFITDMAKASEDGGVDIPPKLSDRIFSAIMFEGRERFLQPRGMEPREMYGAAKRVIDEARGSSQDWSNIGGALTERQVVLGFLRAMEGDVSLVGYTQKFTGAVKSSAPGAGANYYGQISERLYPLMRFTLNPIFQAMEVVEPYILNTMRGIRTPLRRDSEGYRAALASRNAVEQLVRRSTDPDGLMAETAEALALGAYQNAEAAARFGRRTWWSRMGTHTAERKNAAAGLESRRLIGDNLYAAFKNIKGDSFESYWGDLEYQFGTVDKAEVAERWLGLNLSLQDADGNAIGLVTDLLNKKNIGQRLRFAKDGRKGVYTFGDVESLMDVAYDQLGNTGSVRRTRGLKPGEALMADLKNMSLADWRKEVKEVGLAQRVGKISDDNASDIWHMANGPEAEDFWKGYRDTFLQGSTAPTRPGTRKLRDFEVEMARTMVRAWAAAKDMTEAEFIALHTEDIPRWMAAPSAAAAAVPGTLVLTDIRGDWGRAVFNKGGMLPSPMQPIAWAHKSGKSHYMDDIITQDADTGQYLYGSVYGGRFNETLEGRWPSGEARELLKFGDEVSSDPKLITDYRHGDVLFRMKRSGMPHTPLKPSKRNRRFYLDEVLDPEEAAYGVEVLTPEGWRPFSEMKPSTLREAKPGAVPEHWSFMPDLYEQTDDLPGSATHKVDFEKLMTRDEMATTGSYTGFGYRPLNAWLRGLQWDGSGGISDAEAIRQRDLFDNSIRKGVLRKRTTLYRGFNVSDITASHSGDPQVEYERLLPGDTFNDPAFLSTSTERHEAEKFASGFDGPVGGPDDVRMLMTLDVPAGFHANIVEGIEDELVLPRGVEWRVTTVKHVTDPYDGHTTIHMRVVPAGVGNTHGVTALAMGELPQSQSHAARFISDAVLSPEELRARVANVGADRAEGTSTIVEEAIAAGEAAKPLATPMVVAGRKFGRLTPEEVLDDIASSMEPATIRSYFQMWSAVRQRVRGLFRTTQDEGDYGAEPSLLLHDHDDRALAALGTVLPERGMRAGVTQFLTAMERLAARGPRAATEASAAGDRATYVASTHLLRGIRNAIEQPNLSPAMSDGMDTLLDNQTRRVTGRTNDLQPIVADDGAFEAAGYLTQGALDDLTQQGHAIPSTGQAFVPSTAVIPAGPTEPVRSLGGSTGAQQVREGTTGDLYVEKFGNHPDHIREEHYADSVYEAMGVPVPHQRLLVDDAGRPFKRAEMVEGGTSLDDFWDTASASEKAAVAVKLQDNFALDALLANWDVIGLVGDNIVIKNGIPWRIDNGGALRYRAQGAPKGGAFGTHVGEFDTLTNPDMNQWAARIFGNIGAGEVRRQVEALDVARETILAALPPELRDTVGARLDDMLAQTEGVAPTVRAGAGIAQDVTSDHAHEYLVGFYNDMAKAANDRGLGGYRYWNAADVAALASRHREELGRTRGTAPEFDALERAVQPVTSRPYPGPGHPLSEMNPLLDLLNAPTERAARDELLGSVQAEFLREVRDKTGIVLEGVDSRGIGMFDGEAAQPLVPVHLLGTPERGNDLADILSYTQGQAEVPHFSSVARDVAEQDFSAYHPRVSIYVPPMAKSSDAAHRVAEALGRVLPFRASAAVSDMDGGWTLTLIDDSKTLARTSTGEVDEPALAQLLDETLGELGESMKLDADVDYGNLYVAGPDKLPDGTLDWEGHADATYRRLQERGSGVTREVLDGLRSAYDHTFRRELEDAAPANYGRVLRHEPLTGVLEDSRGGQTFGTTTSAAGATSSVIHGFGNTDPLAGFHELIHVFSIAGLDPSLKEAVSRSWGQHVTHIEQAALDLEAKAAATTSKSWRTRYLADANSLRANIGATAEPWGARQEEHLVKMVMDWVDRGVPSNPDMRNVFEHFRNWIDLTRTSMTQPGMPPVTTSPQMQARLDRMFSRKAVETVEYSIEDQAMRMAAIQTVRSSWDEAHATQFYKHDRSMMERSINHPYIGLYPASYMWGKVLPEMVRFLALRPFGMDTPFLGWNVLREVSDTIRTQSETDESFKKLLSDNEDAFMFASMFFPALPQDIPANVSLPVRRIAEQGLENQAKYAAGMDPSKVKDIDYMRGASDAMFYALGPAGTIRTVSQQLGMAGDLVRSGLGETPLVQGDQSSEVLPLR